MSIRRVTPDDAYTIARLRHAMWDEMSHMEPATAAFREATFVFWYETLEAEKAVGWLAETDGTPVGMALLMINEHPPRPFGKIVRGYVHNVYVVPQYRQRGYGKALMEAVIAYGREHGMQRLELRTSDMGRALYESVGFEPAEFMIMRLDQESTKQTEEHEDETLR